jgi:asparagine synthase (glutamine-hydrolysing)
MCGIAGILGDLPELELGRRAAAMAGSLRHRGPDRQSTWVDHGVALAHARLSIIDLSEAGNQPMVSPCGRHVLVFNGEIYNYRELRASLESAGTAFRGHSDTEVLLHLLAKEGLECLRRLNGIFAFAHWNGERRELTLARDRFGAKPLYWSVAGGLLRFGSETKALVAAGLRLSASTDHLSEYLYYGAVGRSATMHQGVRRVPPGYSVVFRGADAPREAAYWRPEDVRPLHVSDSEATGRVRASLESAVRRQLVADVPVGVFLSGGVDSSALAAFAARHYAGKLRTYSVGFDFDRGVNELPRARRTAAHLGTEHQEVHVAAGNLPEVIEALARHTMSRLATPPIFRSTCYAGSWAASRRWCYKAMEATSFSAAIAATPCFPESGAGPPPRASPPRFTRSCRPACAEWPRPWLPRMAAAWRCS